MSFIANYAEASELLHLPEKSNIAEGHCPHTAEFICLNCHTQECIMLKGIFLHT